MKGPGGNCTKAAALLVLLATASTRSAAQVNPKYQMWKIPSLLRGANVVVTQTQRPTSETFTSLRAQGANFVQVVAEGIQQTEPPYTDDTAATRRLATAVRDAGNAGLHVVISMLTGPGLVSVAVEAQQPGLQSKLWVVPAARTAFVQMWRRLALQFRADAKIIGYNLIAEPLPEAAIPELSTTCCASRSDSALRRHGLDWPAFADTLVETIRQVDRLTPILVDATGFSVPQYFSIMRPVRGRYIVYDVHQYQPELYTMQGLNGDYPVNLTFPGGQFRYWRDANTVHALDLDFLRSVFAPVLDFQRRAGGAPVVVGEFGVNRQAPGAAAFIAAETSLFTSYGWPGAMWSWGCCGYMEVAAADSATTDSTRRAIFSAYGTYWRGSHR